MDTTLSSTDPSEETTALPDSALKSIKGLLLVFWGLLIVFADFTIRRDDGIPFDFVNDAIGALILTMGLFRLRRASEDMRYRVVMRLATLASLVFLVLKIAEPWRYPCHWPDVSFPVDLSSP